MKVDFLIVGAGLAGCVLAEKIANVLNKSVLIVDRRDHIGGNAFDYADDNGVIVHKYGPHAFHTNDKAVWDYLSNFTDWHLYFHKATAFIDGNTIPLPFNLNAIYKVFSPNLASRLEDKLIKNFGFNVKIPILKLRQTEYAELKFLADYIYEKVFLGYTVKQWGLKPEELDKSVTSRVPVYISRDDRYFQDKYQAIPKYGYTKMIKNMINHPLINVELEKSFKEISNKVKYDHLIYTGAIDEFFEFKYGKLPYRSLEFKLEEHDREFYQSVAQANYPENHDFTRITEFKYFLDTKTSSTTIAFEYPREFDWSKNEPYYPIPKDENIEKYNLYQKEAKKLDRITFVGRLAEYKYYNMDQIVAQAIHTFNNHIMPSFSEASSSEIPQP